MIDFVPPPRCCRRTKARLYQAIPGGAPANVAVGLGRLGCSTAYIGKVGDDPFGRYLLETLRAHGVDTSAVGLSRQAPTGLAFVTLRRRGEREFHFYRNPCADTQLRPRDIPVHIFARARALHFGSVSLVSEPSRSATWHAVALARRYGVTISFDPNVRPLLWARSPEAKRQIKDGIARAHLVKLSEEDLRFLENARSLETSISHLWRPHHRLFVVTLGRRGCYYRTARLSGFVAGFPARPLDTTGAGDAFMAGLLMGILDAARPLSDLGNQELALICRFANACGSLATQVRGAIPALPSWRQIENLLRGRPLRPNRVRC